MVERTNSNESLESVSKIQDHGIIGDCRSVALVVGSTVYELDGKADDLKALTGEKVKLTGTVDGKKIQGESVSKA